MSENMEQAVIRLHAECLGYACNLVYKFPAGGRTQEDVDAAKAAVLSLYATAIRERDSARALAVQAGKALKEAVAASADEGYWPSVEADAALAALKAAGMEV